MSNRDSDGARECESQSPGYKCRFGKAAVWLVWKDGMRMRVCAYHATNIPDHCEREKLEVPVMEYSDVNA